MSFTFTSGGSSGLNVLQEIWNLGQAIQGGESAAISSMITTLGDAYSSINNEAAINGATLSDLTNQQSAINVIQTNEEGTLSNLAGYGRGPGDHQAGTGANGLPGCPPGYRNSRQPQPAFAAYK